MNNKLKLTLITASLLASTQSNAQTFYQCIPTGCPSGQYFDGTKCLTLPKGMSKCQTNAIEYQNNCYLKECDINFTIAEYTSYPNKTSSIKSEIHKVKPTFVREGTPFPDGKVARYYNIKLQFQDCISYRDNSNSNYKHCCKTQVPANY